MTNSLKKMGFWFSFAIYIPAAFLLWVLTRYLIPYLSRITGQEMVLFWFMVAGLGMFLPLIVLAVVILKTEGYPLNKKTFIERLRFKKLSRRDLAWTIGGLVAILMLSGLAMMGLEWIAGSFDRSPPFMAFEPLTKGRYWLLAAWFPYWILNILGEEILWRGVMFPRQELAFGKYTWLVHGVGWGLFHMAFGWHLLVTLLPIIFIQSYIVQKTRNSWPGVIIHAAINGPSFIAIALGVL